MIVRTTRVLIEVMVASLIVAALLAGYGAWRLSQGPLPVSFLTQDIEKALNSRAGPVRLTLGDTMLAWAGWDRALDLRVTGVRVFGQNGAELARIPEMSVSFSALALLRGVVAPTSLDIIGPRVTIVRQPSGDFAFAFDQRDASGGDLSTAIAAFISRRPRNEGGLSSLRRISVLDAQVTLDDRFTGALWRAPESNIVLLREGGEVRASIDARLDEAAGGAQISGGASWKKGTQSVALEADVSQVHLDRIASRIPGAELLRGLDFAVAGRITASLDLHGSVRSADFTLTSAGGELRKPELWPRGLKLGRLELAGRYLAHPDFLVVERLGVELGKAKLAGRFSAIGTAGDFAVEGGATVRGMPVSQLHAAWPLGVASTGRKWVLANISGGTVDDGRVGFSLDVPQSGKATLESLTGQFQVEGASVRYMDSMPPVRDVAAELVVTPRRLVATVRKGRSAGLRVEAGTVRLTGLGGDKERAAADLRITGPLPDALALINRPRLGFASRVGIDPKSAKGQASVNLSLRFPLIRNLPLEQLQVSARAQITDAGLPRVARGRDLSAGVLTLSVDKKKLELDGTGLLGGVPAQMHWTENFAARDQAKRQYSVMAVLDDDDRRQFGLDVASYVKGPVTLDLAVSESAAGVSRIDAKLELKDAVLSVPGLGWRKKAGAVGVAWFSLDSAPGKPVLIREFNLRTADLEARGTVGFDKKGRLASAGLVDFRYGKTRLAGTLKRRADDGFDVTVEGPDLDIRPVLKGAGVGDMPVDLPPVSISGAVDRVWFGKSPPARQVKGKAAWDGRTLTSATLGGRIGKASRARLAVVTEKDRRRLVLSSDDAGDTLSGLGLIDVDEVRGGSLRLGANQRLDAAAAPWSGTLEISKFAIVKAPVLARMLTLASLTGISDVMSGRGVSIAQVQIPFTYRKGVLTIKDARAVGSELGLTAKGSVDLSGGTVKVDGTIVPAYTINSVLGKVPLLGRLFTADKGSGVFAATYQVTGKLSAPTVSVNPLAALAPGFLRGLVGGLKPDEGQRQVDMELLDAD